MKDSSKDTTDRRSKPTTEQKEEWHTLRSLLPSHSGVQARVLGLPDWAKYKIETKMIDGRQYVEATFDDLCLKWVSEQVIANREAARAHGLNEVVKGNDYYEQSGKLAELAAQAYLKEGHIPFRINERVVDSWDIQCRGWSFDIKCTGQSKECPDWTAYNYYQYSGDARKGTDYVLAAQRIGNNVIKLHGFVDFASVKQLDIWQYDAKPKDNHGRDNCAYMMKYTSPLMRPMPYMLTLPEKDMKKPPTLIDYIDPSRKPDASNA